MVRNTLKVVSYAPLYIHSFEVLQPHFLNDSERFNIASPEHAGFTATADKLRYYRYKKGLSQRDVADAADIVRTTYSLYEEGLRDITDMGLLARIAAILDTDVINLLDDGYISFLYYGQAQQVKALRKQSAMTLTEFAAHFNVEYSTVRKWEKGMARMTRRMWESVFKSY